MTPDNAAPRNDSVPLQTAVRMFLDYLLEHKELLQAMLKEQQGKEVHDSTFIQESEQRSSISSAVVNDVTIERNVPATLG